MGALTSRVDDHARETSMVGHQAKLYTHKTNATILRIAEQLKSNQPLVTRGRLVRE